MNVDLRLTWTTSGIASLIIQAKNRQFWDWNWLIHIWDDTFPQQLNQFDVGVLYFSKVLIKHTKKVEGMLWLKKQRVLWLYLKGHCLFKKCDWNWNLWNQSEK